MTKKPRWRTAVPRLSQFAVEHLLLLPVGALIALAWVNVAPESYYRATFAISFAVNDVAMVFFFAVMTKEVVEATIPGGVLHPWRRALLPVIAALGATVVPALIHSRIVDAFFDEPMLELGSPVAFATDLAFAYFIARIIFRPQHPAIPFVLLLAIASDALGFAVLAVYNPGREVDLVTGGLLMAAAMVVAWGLRRGRVTSFWPYLIGAGGLSWYALFRGGLHPALALVPIMPFLPHAARDPGFFVDASPDAPDTLSQFEVWWRLSGTNRAVFLRARQRRNSASRTGTGNVGAANRRDRRQTDRHNHRDWDCARRRSPPAGADWLAGTGGDRFLRRPRFQRRLVLLRRASAAGPVAL